MSLANKEYLENKLNYRKAKPVAYMQKLVVERRSLPPRRLRQPKKPAKVKKTWTASGGGALAREVAVTLRDAPIRWPRFWFDLT